MSHHIVEVRDLHYDYPDGTVALRGVSFRVLHGEAVALLGANGAGKSTLLAHLNGTLVPDRGEVRVGDVPVTKETLPALRRSVGMVFQDPDDQLFMPTVLEDVAFGPLNMGIPPEESRKMAEAAMDRVGIGPLAERPPHKLSAGEKRAAAIAGVLAFSPDVLLMDEPSSHLDPRGRRRLIEWLKGFEHTRLIATHDLDLAREVCRRAILFDQGRVARDGPISEVLENTELLRHHGLL